MSNDPAVQPQPEPPPAPAPPTPPEPPAAPPPAPPPVPPSNSTNGMMQAEAMRTVLHGLQMLMGLCASNNEIVANLRSRVAELEELIPTIVGFEGRLAAVEKDQKEGRVDWAKLLEDARTTERQIQEMAHKTRP